MNLVDSDVLIQLLRKDPKARAWFASQTELPDVPGFVAMELKFGCENLRDLAAVRRLLRPLAIVWPSQVACAHANSIYGPARLSHSLGILDALIAATALENQATLYTFNVKHFVAVPGLDVQVPYIR